jgi:aryl-alcohol dehydrogenase-like predicted oxidoreductase
VEGEFQRLYSRCGIGLTTFSPIKMGLLSGKYNDAAGKPPPGSRFSESKDRFAESMRENIGNDEWSRNIAKVVKLKVSTLKSTRSQSRTDLNYIKPIAEKLGVTQS